MATIFTGSIDALEFEPYPFPDDDILDGNPNSRVHWVRPEDHGSHVVGIFRSDPAAIRYQWDNDETIHVVEGKLRIEFETGENLELGVGDVGSFTAGDQAVWHILEPFCEVFVLTV